MPIYAYRCSACNGSFDFLQKLSESPMTDCPECKSPTLTKQLTAAGFQLKGSGWYATDFKGGGSKPAASDGDSKPAASAGDSKPAASGGGDSGSSSSESKAQAPASGAGAPAACS